MSLLPDEKPNLRVELAIRRYQTEDISLARAAHLAGISFDSMKKLLVARGIPLRLGPADEQEALQEVEEMQRIVGVTERRLDAQFSFTDKLSFLVEHTHQDEPSVLANALRIGINALYRDAVEGAYIEGRVGIDLAMDVLGAQRVKDIDDAREALNKDVERGLQP